ncbi:hypothetical protein F4604DRAFT_559202 [Suillus subluteus]|nr:hypothetical protein F4604DRAFT_559202 [Suillus subluteus]
MMALSRLRKWETFLSICLHSVRTLLPPKTASIYWTRGQLSVLSLMMKANPRKTLYLFANDELQPLPDGARAFPMIVIAGKVSRGAFTLQQENGFDMDVSQYVAGPQQNMRVRCYYLKGHPRFSKTPLPTASKHVVIQGTVRSVTGDRCMVTVKDIALDPSDMVTTYQY